jgi:hypothetical protein
MHALWEGKEYNNRKTIPEKEKELTNTVDQLRKRKGTHRQCGSRNRKRYKYIAEN